MQFMLGLYEFGEQGADPAEYPIRFVVERFSAYRPAGG
jgi:hypothetical protein